MAKYKLVDITIIRVSPLCTSTYACTANLLKNSWCTTIKIVNQLSEKENVLQKYTLGYDIVGLDRIVE